jgi:hypothetical protein
MTHDDHRRMQAEVLSAVVDLLRRDSRVLGVSMGGSCATGKNDAFSDLDVACWLRDEAKTGRAELYEQVATLFPLLCKLWLYDRHALFQFDNGVRLDLDFNRPSDVGHSHRRPAQILFDPDEVLARGFDAAAENPLPTPAKHFPTDLALVEWFLWMFRQVYCWTKRSQQHGPGWFGKLHGAIDSLDQIRKSLIEMRLAIEGQWDHLDRIDPELARRLAGTFPSFEPAAVLAATRSLLPICEDVCVAYCSKVKVVFPGEKFEALKRLLDEFDGLT